MVLVTEDVAEDGILPIGIADVPMAIPLTGALILMPASIRARVPEHTVAIELEPLLSMSQFRRMVYGLSVPVGIVGFKAAKRGCRDRSPDDLVREWDALHQRRSWGSCSAA